MKINITQGSPEDKLEEVHKLSLEVKIYWEILIRVIFENNQ